MYLQYVLYTSVATGSDNPGYPHHLDPFFSRSHESTAINKNLQIAQFVKVKSTAYEEKPANSLVDILQLPDKMYLVSVQVWLASKQYKLACYSSYIFLNIQLKLNLFRFLKNFAHMLTHNSITTPTKPCHLVAIQLARLL